MVSFPARKVSISVNISYVNPRTASSQVFIPNSIPIHDMERSVYSLGRNIDVTVRTERGSRNPVDLLLFDPVAQEAGDLVEELDHSCVWLSPSMQGRGWSWLGGRR